MNITFIFTGTSTNLCDLLYCGSLKLNLYHLQDMPV